MNRSNFQTSLYNPILKENVTGFLDKAELEKYKKNTQTVIIPVGMSYRPDLVAKTFLNDESMSWLITYINNFTNGIEDYIEGKKIKIPIEL